MAKRPCSAADWAQARARNNRGFTPVARADSGWRDRAVHAHAARRDFANPAIDPGIREQVRALATESALRARLVAEDAEAAGRLGPRDSQRMARALEVIRSTGPRIAYWQARQSGGIGATWSLHPLVLLPEREWLNERCDRRFELMLDGGAIAEVEALLARGLDPALPVMRAIGVPEIAGLIQGELSRAEAIAAGQTRDTSVCQAAIYVVSQPTARLMAPHG